jgi:hypothetical protein
MLQQTVLQHFHPTSDYDPNLYRWLAGTAWKARLDWSVESEHLVQPSRDSSTAA